MTPFAKAVASVAVLVAAIAPAPLWAQTQPATQRAEKAAEAPVSPYKVIRENARVPFASTLRNFSVGQDKTLLLDGPGNTWYRVTLDNFCARDLAWEERIALRDQLGSFDRFSSVIVDGRRCIVRAVDQIEDPRPVDRAARDAKRAAAG